MYEFCDLLQIRWKKYIEGKAWKIVPYYQAVPILDYSDYTAAHCPTKWKKNVFSAKKFHDPDYCHKVLNQVQMFPS